ncbi:ABC transporter ATP-binding protein [Thermosulfurimonas dismutans]|uniref:Branched-chain amino acid transport ATP-binding protein LivG n=1 Tax=Thermosulfurimonas dismutans TaxID=999894 RepID=A0A179D5M2_9BACT|nr:ABC transporter ATP-binding protein [Thermosulfurimonas dismutans]OAQ21395.1 Branched-chain amino acid transport ATP-binding protein LivG [Thermosulfurimonas dismutans]
MSFILEVKNLTKRFGALKAVNGLSFRVRQGTISALIGPNGSGKSTTFNLITGHLKPDSGTILFEGHHLEGLPAEEIARLGIARTFQTPQIFTHLTVLENVLLSVYQRKRPGLLSSLLRLPNFFKKEKEAQEEAFVYLERFFLADEAHRPAEGLPLGKLRHLELARALALKPKLLLLDEAASGLDPREKIDLAEALTSLPQEGITLFWVEHDLNLLMEVAEEVIVLDQGEKIAEGPPREIQRNPRVIQVYLGEEHA